MVAISIAALTKPKGSCSGGSHRSGRRWFYNDGRTASEWSQIQRELQAISDAYGSSGYYRNDPYGRDDDYRRQRNRNVDDWIRRIPWPGKLIMKSLALD